MSSTGVQVSCQSPLENKRLNLIPVGRQVQRTPPNKTPNFQSTRPAEEPAIKRDEDSQIGQQDDSPTGQDDCTGPAVKEEKNSFCRYSMSASAKMGNAAPDAFIQGMQGYQWTDVDLEFVYQAKQQKQLQHLRQRLSEVEKTLQAVTQKLELAVASRDRLRSEMSKTLSCDSLLQLCKSVLSHCRTSYQLEGLGDKALLSLLTLQDIQPAVQDEKTQVRCPERGAQELREKEKLDTYQKKIGTLQANIDDLKMEIVELKTQMLEKETLVVPQVSTEGDQASRSIRHATKTLKEKVLRETSEKETATMRKAGKDKAEEGKTAPKKKATRKATSKKTAKKDTSPEKTAPIETPLQVKTPIDIDPEKMSPTIKFSYVVEVLRKGRKGSKNTKTSSMTPKNKTPKKSALKEPKENKVVPTVTADKEMAKKNKIAPKKRISKKDLVPNDTDTKELAGKEVPPKVNASNVSGVLEKGHKVSQTTTNTSTLRERTVMKKAGEIEADEKFKTTQKVNAPRKVTSKYTAEEIAPDVTVSEVKDDSILNKISMVSTVQAQMMMKTDDREMALGETALRAPKGTALEATAPQLKALKQKATKKTALKKIADMDTPSELTVEGAMVTKKVTSRKRAQKKTLRQQEAKVKATQETDEDDDALMKTVLKKGLKKMSKNKPTVENNIMEETHPEETISKKNVNKITLTKTAQKKRSSKEKATTETVLKETRKRASKEKVTNQKSGNKLSEDKASTNTEQALEGARKAVRSPKSLVEPVPETIRRSKRNTAKRPSLSNVIPEKTTRSRRR